MKCYQSQFNVKNTIVYLPIISDITEIIFELFSWPTDFLVCLIKVLGFSVFQCLEWSPAGPLILCANIKKGVVQVFNIKNPKWKCKLTEGSSGMEKVFWGPDNRSIFIISDLSVSCFYHHLFKYFGSLI